MASLYQRNGIYYANFSNTSCSPQRKRVSLKTSKRRVARRILSSLEDDYRQGVFDPWTDDPWNYKAEPFEEVSIQEAQKRFIQRKKEEGCTPNTLRTYREVLGLLVRQVGMALPMRQLSPASLRAFIRRDDLAPATHLKRYGHVSTFLSWSQEAHLVRENPLEAIKRPQPPEKLPKAITQDELQSLCEALREDYEDKRSVNCIREGQLIWRIPLFWFAFYTGMRGEEIARLRWRDIDEGNYLIYIRKQKNNKEQTIPLNQKAREALDNVDRGSIGDYVFHGPRHNGQDRNPRWFRENTSNAFRKAREAAGLRRELSFHSLRHGFCTALAEAGKSAVVIKEAARHADISTSMRYVHMANERLKAELDDVFG